MNLTLLTKTFPQISQLMEYLVTTVIDYTMILKIKIVSKNNFCTNIKYLHQPSEYAGGD